MVLVCHGSTHEKKLAAALFVVAFVFMLGMGYLSSQFDDSSSMHWLAQSVNIVSQGALLGGVLILHRAGLGRKDALKYDIEFSEASV